MHENQSHTRLVFSFWFSTQVSNAIRKYGELPYSPHFPLLLCVNSLNLCLCVANADIHKSDSNAHWNQSVLMGFWLAEQKVKITHWLGYSSDLPLVHHSEAESQQLSLHFSQVSTAKANQSFGDNCHSTLGEKSLHFGCENTALICSKCLLKAFQLELGEHKESFKDIILIFSQFFGSGG